MKKTYVYSSVARKPIALYVDVPNGSAGGWLLLAPNGPVCGTSCSEDVAGMVGGVIGSPLTSWQPVDESDAVELAAELIRAATAK